jgi:outer membrane protein OmpA-like peptidoglycan-associated protein
MMKLGERRSWWIVVAVAIGLATSGCASKKYVNQRMNQTNQNLAQFQNKTNDRIAYLDHKSDSNTAHLSGRIDATDQRLTEMAADVQDAQGTAARAMEEANASKNEANREATTVQPINYRLVQKSDVLFGFNKTDLTRQSTTALDDIVSKFQATPGAVIELAGFTDQVGPISYNLDLSRRRAWSVQRYLVDHNVPLRSIHVAGLGKDAPPQGLEAEFSANEISRDKNRVARRVTIRVLQAGVAPGAGTEQ